MKEIEIETQIRTIELLIAKSKSTNSRMDREEM